VSARIASVAAAVLCLAGTAGAAAQEAPPPGQDHARIAGQAGSAAAGRIALNQAAGSGNTQTNLAVLATDARGGAAVQVRQQPAPGARARAASAQLQGDAFAGSRGLLSINQVAGSGNAQANLFVVGRQAAAGAVLVATVDDAALAVTAAEPPTDERAAPAALRDARIEDTAFRGSQGVVQLNQTAGVGNRSANAIVLQLPGGTP
jgi:hypothetical protein